MPHIDPDLLAILACPETHQPLTEASADVLNKIETVRAAGGIQNAGGEAVGEAVEAGLIREDGKILYPIRGGIPVLLVEEGIPVPA